MHRGFDGDFRRRPLVTIRGASKSESKESVLRRAKEERRKREAGRRQKEAAILIQSVWRARSQRRRWHQSMRREMDDLRSNLDKQGLKQLEECWKRLAFFFSVQQDRERLVSVACLTPLTKIS